MKSVFSRRPSPALVVAFIALFAALAGTAIGLSRNSVGANQLKKNSVKTAKIRNNAVTRAKIAGNAVNGAKVADGSLTGADVAGDSLTGTNINESTLGPVPSANALGGIAASSYQQKCSQGTVGAWALIDGDNAGIGTAYGTTGVSASFNCATGGGVTVRRVALGNFNVCFANNFPLVALTSPINSVAAGQDNIISWGRVNDAACAGGTAAEVKVLDNDGTTFEDQRFSVAILK